MLKYFVKINYIIIYLKYYKVMFIGLNMLDWLSFVLKFADLVSIRLVMFGLSLDMNSCIVILVIFFI